MKPQEPTAPFPNRQDVKPWNKDQWAEAMADREKQEDENARKGKEFLKRNAHLLPDHLKP